MYSSGKASGMLLTNTFTGEPPVCYVYHKGEKGEMRIKESVDSFKLFTNNLRIINRIF